jgi:hypothetical protein
MEMRRLGQGEVGGRRRKRGAAGAGRQRERDKPKGSFLLDLQ